MTHHPTAPERARSLAERAGPVTLLPAEGTGRTTPELHHVTRRGEILLLFTDDQPVLTAIREHHRPELPAMLELTDTAPVPLREPVRGLLWITGWLRREPADEARAAAMCIAETRPDPRLLDIGHSAELVAFRAASVVLADTAGATAVNPAEFAHATPDPFSRYEAGWLRHLDSKHPEVLTSWQRLIPAQLQRPDARIRPLGLDRYGVRLRVELGRDDHDVRLRFSRPVDSVPELSAELRRLVGCPFLAAVRKP